MEMITQPKIVLDEPDAKVIIDSFIDKNKINKSEFRTKKMTMRKMMMRKKRRRKKEVR